MTMYAMQCARCGQMIYGYSWSMLHCWNCEPVKVTFTKTECEHTEKSSANQMQGMDGQERSESGHDGGHEANSD